MKETNTDINKLILSIICIVLLFLFVVITNNIRKSENNIIQNNIYSNRNSIDENNLKRIPGYNNLYYYEKDLETY